jgi:hypothetical protein
MLAHLRISRSQSSEKHAQAIPQGLDDRMRDRDGQIRKKRSDTQIGMLPKDHGPDFVKGYRSDAHLGTVLNKEGLETLEQPLEKKHA